MLIIVEGIDRVGKTTLCKMLEKELNIPIYKHVGEFDYSEMDNDNETDKMLQMLEICRLSESFIIFDRFHLTDYVYGTIQRGYDVGKAKRNIEMIEEKLCKLDAVLLFVLPTDIDDSSKQHGQKLSLHNNMFTLLYRSSNIKHKFMCTYNTLSEAVCFVKSIINKETRHDKE